LHSAGASFSRLLHVRCCAALRCAALRGSFTLPLCCRAAKPCLLRACVESREPPTSLTQQFLVAGWCETGWTWQVFFGEWTLPWEHDDPFTRLGWDCAQGICIGGVAFCISMSTCIWICMCLRFTFVIAILWGLAIASRSSRTENSTHLWIAFPPVLQVHLVFAISWSPMVSRLKM
jgi:hypothetical protein